MVILFLAVALMFIDMYMPLAPNVNVGGVGINDSVPSLGDASMVPLSKGHAKF